MSTSDNRHYPEDPTPARRLLEGRLHLLDHQILDVGGAPVSAVDDVEFTDPPNGEIPAGTPAPEVIRLVTGLSLGARVFGGRPPARLLHRIAWSDVVEVGTALKLRLAGEDVEATWFERWVRDRIIGRIPGGRHAPE